MWPRAPRAIWPCWAVLSGHSPFEAAASSCGSGGSAGRRCSWAGPGLSVEGLSSAARRFPMGRKFGWRASAHLSGCPTSPTPLALRRAFSSARLETDGRRRGWWGSLSAPASPSLGLRSAGAGRQRRHLRRDVRRQHTRETRIGKALERALVGGEAGLEVGGERGGVVERAGVDREAPHARLPGEPQGFGEQPLAMALAGELGDEAEETDQAFAGVAEIELQHADL